MRVRQLYNNCSWCSVKSLSQDAFEGSYVRGLEESIAFCSSARLNYDTPRTERPIMPSVLTNWDIIYSPERCTYVKCG